MRIWLLGIEPLEERYSSQWARWWPTELRALGHEVFEVGEARLTNTIERGEFLDAYDTHYWKAMQTARMAHEFHAGHVQDGDVILLLDAWNPAVTSLAYMRDVAGPKVKIAGLFHAGTYDPHDLLAQKGLAPWAGFVEQGWVRALDHIFVATDFHAHLLSSARPCGNVHVTGFPLYADEWALYARPWEKRERLVVFPHRLAKEKQPSEFESLRRAYERTFPDDQVQWVRSKDVCSTKQDYYRLLASSRVAVSTALQETWGIAMLEAASLGCHVVVPNRLSYPDTFPGVARYRWIDDAVQLVRDALDAPAAAPWDGSRWESAIARVAAKLTPEGP